MTITVYPIDAVSGSPLYSARQAREALSVFSAGATAADPFACRSGVRPGTSATTVTATSTTWTIGAHAGILDVEPAIEASGYPYAINAVGGLPTGTVTAANATYARVDIVWLRTDDPAETDGSSVPAVVAGYTAGTAASSPTPPTTPARCMVLAWINVPVSGGGSPTVTPKAPYAVAAGAPIPVNSQAERDALTGYLGLRVQRLDVAGTPIDTHNGTAWVLGDTGWITPTLLNGWTAYPAFVIPRYRRLNGVVIIQGVVAPGSYGTAFVLPAGFRPAATLTFITNANAGVAEVRVYNSGNVDITNVYVGTSAIIGLNVAPFPADA